MKVYLKWQALGLPDSSASHRILDVSEPHFRAILPLRVAKTTILGQTTIVPIQTNLYKLTTSTSQNDIAYTHRLMEHIGCDLSKSYSCGLWDATERVLIIDDDFHYATENEPNLNYAAPIAISRARRFPASWRASESSYVFTERESQPQADAIITDRSDVTICAYSSDCVVALISDRKHHAVGVLHSMWRNMVGAGLRNQGDTWSIIHETLYRMMTIYGSKPADIEVVLFPCASPENYEVGEEVAEKYRSRGLEMAISERDERYYLNLNLAATILFMRCGVPRENITAVPYSTDDPEFASLRNTRKGRNTFDANILSDEDVDLRTVQRRPVELEKENWQNVLIVKTNEV